MSKSYGGDNPVKGARQVRRMEGERLTKGADALRV